MKKKTMLKVSWHFQVEEFYLKARDVRICILYSAWLAMVRWNVEFYDAEVIIYWNCLKMSLNPPILPVLVERHSNYISLYHCLEWGCTLHRGGGGVTCFVFAFPKGRRTFLQDLTINLSQPVLRSWLDFLSFPAPIIYVQIKKSVNFWLIPDLSREYLGMQDYVVHSFNSFVFEIFCSSMFTLPLLAPRKFLPQPVSSGSGWAIISTGRLRLGNTDRILKD